MKKLLLVLLLTICLFGCGKKEEVITNDDALSFKLEYETLNGKFHSNGFKIRELSININNPYVKITTKELLEKINNNESLYVYFGDPLCPWCRSVLEESIKIAKEANVNKIYYIKIWDDEGKEILRDTYILNKKGKPEISKQGTDDYYALLKIFKNVLDDYTLINSKGKKVSVGEKRIFAPSFIFIKNGKAIRMTTGVSDKQKESIAELTDDIISDEDTLFRDFFKNE